MAEVVFDARIKGDQLDLDGNEYFCNDDAILDDGSSAADGVVIVDPTGGRVLDIEIFDDGLGSSRQCLWVYPLDGQDKPVKIVVEHYDGTPETVARIARFAIQMRRTRDYGDISSES